jgi:hypothetical protein
MPAKKIVGIDATPDVETSDEYPVRWFSWTCKRTGETITLMDSGDMEFGVFEDALGQGDAGVGMLVTKACKTEEDHAAVRRLRMRETNALFTAWSNGATPGE